MVIDQVSMDSIVIGTVQYDTDWYDMSNTV
jgi:hypothetical protein